MRSDKWQKIDAARKLLQLGDEASQVEIKRAYRRLAKRHHPDLRGRKNGAKYPDETTMRELNSAYRVLLDYCASVPVPLTLNEANKPLDDEDWWLSRFGEDPLWSKKS
jgi:hypothetical protein